MMYICDMSRKIQLSADEQNIPLLSAIGELGLAAIARECGVKYQSVMYWRKRRRLPDTEFTGQTQYALQIWKLSRGKYSVEALRDLSHEVHVSSSKTVKARNQVVQS